MSRSILVIPFKIKIINFEPLNNMNHDYPPLTFRYQTNKLIKLNELFIGCVFILITVFLDEFIIIYIDIRK